jgi:CRISPR-associated protein Cas1
MLTGPTRRRIAEKVRERLESTEPYEGKRQALRIAIQSQARHAATYLRGDREAYTPFISAW